MNNVSVVTDSSACVPNEIVDQFDIYILPLLLIFEDRSYKDGVDITANEFYRLLEKSKRLPTSSSPSPGEYFEAFEKLSRNTDSILCITLPPHLGMAYSSAIEAVEIARENLPRTTIRILPSRGPALAQGFIAQAAAQAAKDGHDLETVVEAAQNMMKKVNALAVLDTLYYLAKGGRIPKAAAWAGDLLKIKPILDATDDVRLLERSRSKKRAVKRLLEIMKERTDGNLICVNLMHANVPQEAEELKHEILSKFSCQEFYTTDFTPVIGTHTGPGSIGISFYANE